MNKFSAVVNSNVHKGLEMPKVLPLFGDYDIPASCGVAIFRGPKKHFLPIVRLWHRFRLKTKSLEKCESFLRVGT